MPDLNYQNANDVRLIDLLSICQGIETISVHINGECLYPEENLLSVFRKDPEIFNKNVKDFKKYHLYLEVYLK